MKRKKELVQGDKVVIIWTKKNGLVEIDAEFISYTRGIISEDTPLFKTKDCEIYGEDCFWLLKKHANKKRIKKYQKSIIPMQVQIANIADKTGEKVPLKVKEARRLMDKKLDMNKTLQLFIKRYGYDPTDDTWIEQCLANSKTEKDWFEFTRTERMPPHVEEMIDVFNKRYGENITQKDAVKMTVRKVRYVFGAFETRQKGINDIETWKKEAVEFEKRFSDRDTRMSEWVSKKTKLPWVTTKSPVEFWAGSMLMKFMEKIPHVFSSPDCDYIKSGVSLEVQKFDPVEKWIHLDFTPDVRKIINGTEDVLEKCPYAIVVKPENIYRSLDGVDDL